MPSDARRKMVESAVTLLATRGLKARPSVTCSHGPGPHAARSTTTSRTARINWWTPPSRWPANALSGVLDLVDGTAPRDVTAFFLDLWREVLVRSGLSAGCAVLAVTVATDSPTFWPTQRTCSAPGARG